MVRMIVTAAIALTLVLCVASGALAARASFPDVSASHPYYTAIGDLASRGIISGYLDGRFGPSDLVTRQQFAKMAVLTGGYPVSEADICPFPDVQNSGLGGLYPDNYVAVCAAKGLTTGKTATRFDPSGRITRYQVVSMVVRMVGNFRPDMLSAPPSTWKATAGWADDPTHGGDAALAEFNGLLAGLDLAVMDPYGNMTRGEVAQVLHNLLLKLAASQPGFDVRGKPFKFLAALVPGWYWGQWSETNDIALVTQAKQAGFSVLQIPPPLYENPVGTFHEEELRHLDHLAAVAGEHGMYLILPFTHGVAISVQPDVPFFNPQGLGGLIRDPALRHAFKQHMARLITRVNSVNGRKYSEDPVVLSWMIIEEPVTALSNYPNGFPDMSAAEIAEWVQDSGSYVKTLDDRHLVSIMTTAAIDTFDSKNQDWRPIFEVPALDFIEAEDAEARIVIQPNTMHTYDVLFGMRKPVVVMLSYTSGSIDQNRYRTDYDWQSDTMRRVADLYLERGAAGLTIFAWRANTYDAPSFDSNYSYTIDNTPITAALLHISNKLGALNNPPTPLDLVGLAG